MYRDIGEYKQSVELLEKGLEGLKKHASYSMWRVGTGLCLGSAYAALGEYGQAKKVLLDCSDVLEGMDSNRHALEGWLCAYLGDVYRHIKEYKKARELLEKGVTHFGDKVNKGHAGHTLALARLGALYVDMGEMDKAKNTLEYCVKLMEKLFGKSHVQLGDPLYHMGRMYLKEKEYTKAEKVLQQSLEKYKRVNHTDMYKPLEVMGDLYATKAAESNKAGHTSQALHEAQQALEFLSQALDIVQERCLNTSEHLLRLQKKKKMTQKF